MLKALELIGFKSFADKTRFDFDRGITAIVGPNGSGKSNIVDAIKWILGEQSAKSLRGREMADCIFNGSDSRRGLGCAEATLIFDNTSGLLPLDTPEVQITRRVYRSGEGEYLINRSPARLKDIRELFLGTGITTEAYSVIEQGKVDVLLQASTRDRRAIFEEAAGISRFKAKKIETLQKLDRVEQNVTRLTDIVEEVESQLRGVRRQAAKAQQFRQHTDRLRALRIGLGLIDYRRLSEQLEQHDQTVAKLEERVQQSAQVAEGLDAETAKLEEQLSELEDSRSELEAGRAENSQAIASRKSAIEHQRARLVELESLVAEHRRRAIDLSAQSGSLQHQSVETAMALEAAEQSAGRRARVVRDAEASLASAASDLHTLRQETEQRRHALIEGMNEAAGHGNELSGLDSRLQALQAGRQRHVDRRDLLQPRCQKAQEQFDAQEAEGQQAVAELEESRRELEAARLARQRLRDQREVQIQHLASHRETRSAAVERAAVLEDLERRQEGLNAGVKEVLDASRSSAPGPWSNVRGVLADLIHVDLEHAELVELALGPSTGYLVVDDSHEMLELLLEQKPDLAGRVALLRLDAFRGGSWGTWIAGSLRRSPTGSDPMDLTDHEGVLARVSSLVRPNPEFELLVDHLLGNTWLVQDLPTAFRLTSEAPECRFITRTGEMLDADGTVTLGPAQSAAGLISRKSELRRLRKDTDLLDSEIELSHQSIDSLDQDISESEHTCNAVEQRITDLADRLAQNRSKMAARRQELDEIAEEGRVLASEITQLDAESEEIDRKREVAQADLHRVNDNLEQLRQDIRQADRRLAETEGRHHESQHRLTVAKVELATSEKEAEGLRQRLDRQEERWQQHQRALGDAQSQLIEATGRLRHTTLELLRNESDVARFFLEKDRLEKAHRGLLKSREQLRSERQELVQSVQQHRGEIRGMEDQYRRAQLEASELRHELDHLIQRLREDYEVDLEDLARQPAPDEPVPSLLADEEQHADVDFEHTPRAELEGEVEKLRRKIAGMENVNLDALRELDELAERYETLSQQRADLVASKEDLEEIIRKLNADSCKIFSETLESVRGHFQELFRKLFGGGRADIVLEDENDVLESGIEIIARPPGKEPRRLSLLSGGEKTLTAVALLLAIFRNRPSPFCVLDEVDAALDEANIDRFIEVLREFLAWTQFIVITHSKRTMTCAGVLYGVTMQESGVSKRVAVRFEDVHEDGSFKSRPTQSEPTEPALEQEESDDREQAA